MLYNDLTFSQSLIKIYSNINIIKFSLAPRGYFIKKTERNIIKIDLDECGPNLKSGRQLQEF